MYKTYIANSTYIKGWGAGKFLAAPAPDFFFKRLRLLIFFPPAPAPAPAPAPGIFFRAAPAPRGQKKPAPDYWLSLEKCFFPAN